MIVKLQLVGRILIIFTIVLSVSMYVTVKPSILSSFSNVAGEEDNRNFLNGIDIPKDTYLQARVIVNGFELTTDLAITADQKAEGLAVKDHLKENEGMLFVSEQSSRQSFWMKDMKFAIDIIWLDSNRVVVHIEHNLQPCVSDLDCPLYSPDKNALYILETVAGFSQKHNVNTGTQMDFHLIK